jgi:integrase/recombinase XerD
MTALSETDFKRLYASLEKHLRLNGLRPKTIEAYARGIRRHRGGVRLSHRGSVGRAADGLLQRAAGEPLLELGEARSLWLKFFYAHVLRKPWLELDLVKPPRGQRLPDIVTVQEVARLVQSTRVPSYRVLLFTLYSLGLRLGEGSRLTGGRYRCRTAAGAHP